MRDRILLGALILLAFNAVSARAELHRIPLSADPSRIDVDVSKSGAVRFHAQVGELAAYKVSTPKGEFTRLMMPGFHASRIEGAPELPVMNRLLAIPEGAEFRIEIEKIESRLIDLSDYGITGRIMPAQPSMPKDADPATWPFAYDPSAYEVEKIAPQMVRLVELGRLRALNLGRIEVAPIEYLPGSHQIRVAVSIDFQVVFTGADVAKANVLKPALYSPFFDHLYQRIPGVKSFQDDYPDLVADVVTMVIITPPMFESQLQPLVEWKTERGFHVITGVIGSPEVGSTATSIQAYIHDLYLDPPAGLPAPSFVLLVGDTDQVPTFDESGNATDRPYCAVDGDYVPDIYYGRLSATNGSQLQAILDKTLMYDQYAMPDPAYLEQACLVAGVDNFWSSTHANGQINYGSTFYFNVSHGITSHTYLYPESGGSAAQIVQDVSDGVALVNYTAHGSTTSWSNPGFTQTDVLQLGNAGRYCLAIGNCCSTSEFDYGECFAETWLRAPDRGAIGYIGGSNSTYWDEDYWWAVGACASGDINANPTFAGTGLGAYDGLFHEHGEGEDLHYVTNAAIMFCGNLAVMEAGSSRSDYYWDIYNLMGDPSLATWFGVPQANPVVHPPAVFTNSASLTLQAVGGSYAGLTQDGVLIGAGSVGAGGLLEIEFLQTPLTPGVPLRLVVTAQNRAPYVADIEAVVPAEITIVPDVIPVNSASAVTVTVMEPDGTTPMAGIDIWAEGLGYASPAVATDASGVAQITVTYPYGPQLNIVGKDPAESYRLFTRPITVTAAALTEPDLTVITGVGLNDTFALNLPGVLRALVGEPGHTVHAVLPDGTDLSTTSDSLLITSNGLGEVTGTIAVSGYDLYCESFPVIEAYGTLSGTVTAAGVGLAGVTIRGYDEAWNLAFQTLTDSVGVYAVNEEILVAPYTIVVDHFGHLHHEESVFLNYGQNERDIDLSEAPYGVLNGTVSDAETAEPLAATVQIYRADTMELCDETTSVPSDGSFTTVPLPYYEYIVKIRVWRHVPLSISIGILDPVVEKHFLLDPTNGDLLLIDDSELVLQSPPKYAGKGRTLLAPGYSGQGRKAAADLAADLEQLGYFVFVESIDQTDPATWTNYDLLLVSCGDNTSPLGNATVRTALESYVQAGGHLLIEGGEVGYDACSYPGYPSFAADVLHVEDWEHDESGDLTLAAPLHPVLSTPNLISGPLDMTYNFYGDQDALSAAAEAAVVASWSSYPGQASVICYDPNPAPEGGQIVFFAFNWSALDPLVRADLLQNAAAWLLAEEIGDCAVSGRVSLRGESDHGGITVQAQPGGGSVVTGPDGMYELTGLFAGPYRVIASRDGWSISVEDVTLAPGQQLADLDFILQPVHSLQDCRPLGLSIPDSNAVGVSDAVTVPETGNISGVEVFVDVTHTYIGDLVLTLESPSGTTVTLHDRDGGNGDDVRGWYPVELPPSGSLDVFLGEQMQGQWKLTVCDLADYDLGTLNEWCLKITYANELSNLEDDQPPRVLAIAGNWPNPFNPLTRIVFDLPRDARVNLTIFDLGGRRIATLVDQPLPAGRHEVRWSGRDMSDRRVASGTYCCRLVAGGKTLTHKMLLLK